MDGGKIGIDCSTVTVRWARVKKRMNFFFQIPPPWVPGDEVQDEADFRHFQDFIENDLDIGFEAFECLPDEVPPPCEFNHL